MGTDEEWKDVRLICVDLWASVGTRFRKPERAARVNDGTTLTRQDTFGTRETP